MLHQLGLNLATNDLGYYLTRSHIILEAGKQTNRQRMDYCRPADKFGRARAYLLDNCVDNRLQAVD